jgi:abequosyltransferase
MDLPVEIIVSDNCSKDDTSNVVENFISKGMNINYIRNSSNLGMDGNFAQCYRMATGKYILVLGDDDFLIDGMLKKLISKIRNTDYGIIHLHPRAISDKPDEIFINPEFFLKNISFWITYITSNIVNSKYVKNYDFEKYSGTYLTIVPLYLTAALSHKKNLMINERIFSDGVDISTNGGYNFYEVFLENYLCIWADFKNKNFISIKLYYWIKKDIYNKFLLHNGYNLLIKKEKNNYNLEKSFSRIFSHYCYHSYFYTNTLSYLLKKCIKRLFKI